MKQPKITVTLATALAQQAFERLRQKENKTERELEKVIASDPLCIRHRKNISEIEKLRSQNEHLKRALDRKYKREIYIYDKSVSIRGKSRSISIAEIKTELLMLNHVDGVEVKQLVDKFLERHKE